jgi:hypothetical protein
MRRFRLFAAVFLVPVLAYLAGTLGCSSSDNKGSTGSGGPPVSSHLVTPAGDRTPLEAKGFATIKGQVTYDGEPPDPGSITSRQDFKEHKDKAKCEEAPDDLKGQAWRLSGDKVADVVVWVKPPDGKYFPIPPNDKKTWKDKVELDQPHCAFQPHVQVVYPEDNKGKSTGQKFTVVNNSKDINHNTKWSGGQKNSSGNQNIPPGKTISLDLHPDRVPVEFQCDFHKWMNAYAWVFDHPYAAVTDKDGKFEIKNVPAGVKLQIVAWHEGANQGASGPDQGFVLPDGKGSRNGQELGELKDGETKDFNFKVKK